MNDEGKLRGDPLGASGVSDEEPAWNSKGDRYRQPTRRHIEHLW
jgi:hypothetical protein